MYEIMFYAGVVCFVLGCVVTIILFIKNDIAKTIGDVTGHNAKKAMKKMQQEREEKSQEREDKPQAGSKEKKGKRSFFGKMRDEKTSVLLNQDNKTEVLQKSDNPTDVLPQPPKRSGELLKKPQAIMEPEELKKPQTVMKSQEEQAIASSGEPDFSHVFQVEEEMTVLGGEIVDTLPTTILSEEISFSSELDADLETDVLTEEITSVLWEEATDVLAAEEATDVLMVDGATDVLTAVEVTNVLAAEEATDKK